jgi:hypothetical protein
MGLRCDPVASDALELLDCCFAKWEFPVETVLEAVSKVKGERGCSARVAPPGRVRAKLGIWHKNGVKSVSDAKLFEGGGEGGPAKARPANRFCNFTQRAYGDEHFKLIQELETARMMRNVGSPRHDEARYNELLGKLAQMGESLSSK